MPPHIKGLDFVKVKKDCEDFHLNYYENKHLLLLKKTIPKKTLLICLKKWKELEFLDL